MVLTGTPIGNSVLDLYTQLDFLYPGLSASSSFDDFKSKFAKVESSGAGFEKIIGINNAEFLKRWLNRVSFITNKRKVLPTLPEKVYDVEEVEMSDRQRQIYNEAAMKLLVEIEEELEHGHKQFKQLEVGHILTRMLRLAQITSGFVVWSLDPVEDENGDYQTPKVVETFSPNPKMDALISMLRDKTPYQKTIVWSCWVNDLRAIDSTLKNEGIRSAMFYGGTSERSRDEIVRSFNDSSPGSLQVLVGNPAAGGVGLNLLGHEGVSDNPRTYCDHMIYYAVDWSYLKRSQSEARSHRRGTVNNVRITDLTMTNTIDEEIRLRVNMKKAMHMELTDVRSLLSTIRSQLF
jgi:non-specific serine/threonine protein kinase